MGLVSKVSKLMKKRRRDPADAGDEFEQYITKQNQIRQHLMPAQDMTEFSGFLRLLVENNVQSYLEIGSRFGGTLNMVMRLLPPGSRAVAVDLPDANWGMADSEEPLRMVTDSLNADGYNIELLLGNSRSDEIIEAVTKHGPFDAALIDGDHLYEGVKADWENYGKLARIVAFHDVSGEGMRIAAKDLPVEVPRLWKEIKSSGFETREFVRPGSNMGIGVVLQ